MHPLRVRTYDYEYGTGAVGDALYNGNIAYTTYANRQFEGGDVAPSHYRYDQLNRLTKMNRHESFNKGYTGTWGSSLIYDYAESIAYDANGNITRYKRYASTMASPDLDSLTYHYPNGDDDNKLGYVSDAVPYLNSAVDIDDQSAGNYQYDAIGNLISDASEEIDYISWTVYGKIKKIGKKDGSTIEYDYDAAGNRIAKRVKPKGDPYKQTTYYFRDAQGNVLGVSQINRTAFASTKILLLIRRFRNFSEYRRKPLCQKPSASWYFSPLSARSSPLLKQAAVLPPPKSASLQAVWNNITV